ncbi:hypothetical protein ACR76W_11090, partial [Enterococcus casseliflavus]|uniref:hypothetical protein n=1 Tax=Enterococcus casseliflavus TaxID=37734 RepID=UPI003DA33A58
LELGKDINNRRIYYICILGYFLRIVTLIWISYFSDIFQLPNTGSDNLFFHNLGVLAGQNIIEPRNNLYSDLLGMIYKLFDGRILMGSYLNILLSMSSVVLLFRALKLININFKVKLISISLYTLWPNFIIISSVTLRESIIIFLISLSILKFTEWWVTNKKKYFWFSLVSVLLATLFHSGTIAILVGYTIGFILFQNDRSKADMNVRSISACIVLVIFLVVVMNFGGEALTAKFQRFESISDTVEDVVDSRGGSGYSVGLSVGNPLLNLIVNTPIRLIFFLFSPLSWRGLADVLAFLSDSVLYFILTFSIINKLPKKLKNDKLFFSILISLFITCVLFSWGVSNAGTALRHRTKILPLFIFLFSISKGKIHNEQLNRKI